MSTINPNLPQPANPAYPPLGRSLISLSARFQPAAPSDSADPGEAAADGAAGSDPAQEVARQNRFSALADSAAAAAANQSAEAAIAGRPAAAYAAQATLAPESALGLLETDGS